MVGTPGKDYHYASRIYKQKAVEKQVEEDIKTMVYTMLGNEKELEIDKAPDGQIFDIYPSCSNWEKKYCKCKGKKWKGVIGDNCENFPTALRFYPGYRPVVWLNRL